MKVVEVVEVAKAAAVAAGANENLLEKDASADGVHVAHTKR